MFPPLERTAGAIVCSVVELLVREIMRDWVCKLSFRKMAVTFSTCRENDEIRARDICLRRFPPLKEKKHQETHTHPGSLRLPGGERCVSGVGLLALAGWVSQFEINFFSVFLPSWGPDQLPLCRWAFLIFKEGRWCMKQINCSFRDHICMASHLSFCQAGGDSDFFFPKGMKPN